MTGSEANSGDDLAADGWIHRGPGCYWRAVCDDGRSVVLGTAIQRGTTSRYSLTIDRETQLLSSLSDAVEAGREVRRGTAQIRPGGPW